MYFIPCKLINASQQYTIKIIQFNKTPLVAILEQALFRYQKLPNYAPRTIHI